MPDVGNPWLDAGIVAFSTMNGTRTATTGRSGTRPTSSPKLPRPVPQLVLRAARDEHDDGRRGTAVQDAARLRDGEGPVRPRHAQERPGTRSSSSRPRTRAARCPTRKAIRPTLRRHRRRRDALALLPAEPGVESELRADAGERSAGKFHIKLWNCYGFFCNYARLDGFDPTAPQVPVAERADIDRWILQRPATA